jgi:hypothetical protein
MSDETITARIERLVAEEHALRTREQSDVEIELDQCWDLLRQRRAARDAGGDPDSVRVRDPNTVERYWQ